MRQKDSRDDEWFPNKIFVNSDEIIMKDRDAGYAVTVHFLRTVFTEKEITELGLTLAIVISSSVRQFLIEIL